MDGVDRTGDLDRRVSSSGHLDVSNAVQLLGLNVSESSSPEVVPLTECGGAALNGSTSRIAAVVISMLLLVLWL